MADPPIGQLQTLLPELQYPACDFQAICRSPPPRHARSELFDTVRPRWVSSAVGRASPRCKPSGGARLLVEEARLERLLHGVGGGWAGSIWALSGGASRWLRASSAASSLVRGLFIPMFVGLAVTCIYLCLVRRSTVTKGLVYLSLGEPCAGSLLSPLDFFWCCLYWRWLGSAAGRCLRGA